jgi:hypothetical protein
MGLLFRPTGYPPPITVEEAGRCRLPLTGRAWARRYLAGFAAAARGLRDWQSRERADWRYTLGPVAIDPFYAGYRAGLAAGWGQ